MYIIENSNCCYSEEQIKNYILDMNAFEVLQNIDCAFDKKKWTDANWFIDRLQFELFVISVLWKGEYIDLTTVLNEIRKT